MRLLVEPPRASDLAPEREGLLELGLDLRPGVRAPALVQHRTQDAVDAELGVPEAGVGVVHFPFGPRSVQLRWVLPAVSRIWLSIAQIEGVSSRHMGQYWTTSRATPTDAGPSSKTPRPDESAPVGALGNALEAKTEAELESVVDK